VGVFCNGHNEVVFGARMQNEMYMTIGRLKSKPEVEFQYGGRSFSPTGSSYNSAAA